MSVKDLIYIDSDGRSAKTNHFEVVARGENKWMGWLCSIGTNTLHINFEGDVYKGVCQIGEKIGNVYESLDFELPKARDWVKCDRICHCAADFYTPKIKEGRYALLLGASTDEDEVQNVNELNDVIVVKSTHPTDVYTITWDITKNCNFTCSYCVTRSKGETDLTLEQLKKFVDKINKHIYGRFHQAKFILAGGEPTMHPQLLEFLTYAKSFGHRLIVNTNASKSADYLIRLFEITDCLHISVHTDFTKGTVFVKKMTTILNWISFKNPHFGKCVVLKFMIQPKQLQITLDMLEEIKKIENFEKYVILEFAPLQTRDEHFNLLPYSEEELKFLSGN